MAFRDLTEIQDQGTIIEEVKKIWGDKSIYEIEKEVIDGGICYMLSMEWIQRVIESNDDPIADFNNLCLDDEQERKKKLAYFKQIANNFFPYAMNYFHEADTDDNDAINSFFVDLCSKGKLQAHTVCGNRARISQAFTRGKSKFYLLGYTADWVDQDGNVQSEGHEMAFAVNTSGKLWFYDPNTGVHEADTLEDILDKIDETYFEVPPNTCVYDLCEVM